MISIDDIKISRRSKNFILNIPKVINNITRDRMQIKIPGIIVVKLFFTEMI